MRLPKLLAAVVGVVALLVEWEEAAAAPPPQRPNILWIIVDDMSANFSC